MFFFRGSIESGPLYALENSTGEPFNQKPLLPTWLRKGSIPKDPNVILLMAEILHQLIGSLSHYLQGFIHPRWLAGFLPSTVVSIFLFSP